MRGLGHWKARAATLRRETLALYLACRDPRVPWYAKLLVALIVAYALSPVDLIPDFIPVLGHVDDLVLIPLGIALAVRLIPVEVLAEHRAEAARVFSERRPHSWIGGMIVLAVWLVCAIWFVLALHRWFGR